MQSSGDQDAQRTFRSWLEEHTGVVYKVACGFTATNEDREDPIQEILLQLWRSLPRYRAKAKDGSYLADSDVRNRPMRAGVKTGSSSLNFLP